MRLLEQSATTIPTNKDPIRSSEYESLHRLLHRILGAAHTIQWKSMCQAAERARASLMHGEMDIDAIHAVTACWRDVRFLWLPDSQAVAGQGSVRKKEAMTRKKAT